MSEERINENELLGKLNMLLEKQTHFEDEISELRAELDKVKQSIPFHGREADHMPVGVYKAVKNAISESVNANPVPQFQEAIPNTIPFSERQKDYYEHLKKKKSKRSSDIEKFIGENLINKIGILITIIGVAIGAKYAIEHQLISPLTRILLGYFVGIVLLGFALRLKKEYQSFSAVLMSGAMAIAYFITYAAYSFYSLFPQYITFGLMVLITVVTVYAAIKYNRQVIAHIGMVGAYGIPFLLSNGSGNMVVLFTYMSIVNLGIMVLAFKKYWKPIYYFSFALSWLIYFAWFSSSYQDVKHFSNAFLFLSVFYLIFYITYLSFNLIRKELFSKWDIVLILANSFIFYGIGYTLLVEHPEGHQYLGLFTFITAFVHLLVCGLIYKMKLVEWHLFYFISALALTFFTIAVPVQLSGNWITLLWVGEAGLLFWIARLKQISIYEHLSFVLMILALFSIIGDWDNGYRSYALATSFKILPVANIYFITSFLFVAVFSFINLLNRNERYPTTLKESGMLYSIMQFIIPGILFSVLYFMFWFEISNYCQQIMASIGGRITNGGSGLTYSKQYLDLGYFRTMYLLDYSLFFFLGLSVLNIKYLKNKLLGFINLNINMFVILLFLTQGLYTLSELRDNFLNQSLTYFYHPSVFNILIRYTSYLFVIPLLIISYRYVHQDFLDKKLDKAYSLILHTVILWILSSELITWIDYFGGDQVYKLGLSLLWGSYSLILIILGIWKKLQHIRIGAIVLFSATLLKVFFYDLQDMGTISKTIVFVTLGILLLIISFLYNKYKHIIWNNDGE